MADSNASKGEPDVLDSPEALSVWNNEGGAFPVDVTPDVPELTNTELVHLRVRVIALENLVIALLANGSERQLEVAREMASYISPRAGFTQHPLTVKAADHMGDMVHRAEQFRSTAAP
ncbi:MAG: hypothetical protein R6W87_02660 [Halospina sp.]